MIDLIILPKARNFIKKLKDKNLKNKIEQTINNINKNPKIGKAKIGDLKGILCVDFYHVGINYEIAYKIVEENEIIYIILIGVRGDFYEDLKNYLRELDI